MSDLIIYTVTIGGVRLPYNPENIVFSRSKRENNEFISTTSGDTKRTVSIGGGISPVRKTVSFTIFQQMRSPYYAGPAGEESFDTEDYIGMLEEAFEKEEVMRLEIVMSLPRAENDPVKDGDTIISRSTGLYQVDNITPKMDSRSMFLKTAEVTFREYTQVPQVTGTLVGNIEKGSLTMTFTRSDVSADKPDSTRYTAYTNTCALAWIYDMLGQTVAPGDDPREVYPPGTYLTGSQYPMGTESHLSEGQLPTTPEVEGAETWGEMTTRYMHNLKNGVVYATSAVVAGIQTGMQAVETGISTVISTVYPFISTGVRIGAAAASIMSGNWVGLATYALADYPWTGNLISNVYEEYTKSQNFLTSLGNGVKYSVMPGWLSISQGLGYDAEKHQPYFHIEDIPMTQAPFAPGNKTPSPSQSKKTVVRG